MLKKITIISVLLLCLISGTYFNAVKVNTRQIRIRQESITSNEIDGDLNGLLIVYFSDLYYGQYIDSQFLANAVSKINMFKPDVIIFGGNLIEQNTGQDDLMSALSSLEARYGKYAVLGENDGQLVHDILLQTGFDIIENDSRPIMVDRNSYINLVGIDHLDQGDPDPHQAFSSVNSSHYTFAVSHCPDIFDEILSYDFDYLLSGHSLGGQIYIPLISLFNRPEGCRKYFRGKITKQGKTIDITNGLGRIDHDARLLADAEIVLYTLHSSE